MDLRNRKSDHELDCPASFANDIKICLEAAENTLFMVNTSSIGNVRAGSDGVCVGGYSHSAMDAGRSLQCSYGRVVLVSGVIQPVGWCRKPKRRTGGGENIQSLMSLVYCSGKDVDGTV